MCSKWWMSLLIGLTAGGIEIPCFLTFIASTSAEGMKTKKLIELSCSSEKLTNQCRSTAEVASQQCQPTAGVASQQCQSTAGVVSQQPRPMAGLATQQCQPNAGVATQNWICESIIMGVNL